MKRVLAFSAVLATLLAAFVFMIPAMASMAGGIEGKWQFVLDTEGGDREAPAEFTLDGKTIGGKWGEQPTKGTFADGALSLEFDFESNEVGKGVMKIDGKLDGDTLTGNWKFQEYSGTFKATRPKE